MEEETEGRIKGRNRKEEKRKEPKGGRKREEEKRMEPKGGKRNERKENERRKRKMVLNVMRTHSLQSAEGRRMYNFRN